MGECADQYPGELVLYKFMMIMTVYDHCEQDINTVLNICAGKCVTKFPSSDIAVDDVGVYILVGLCVWYHIIAHDLVNVK